MASAQRDAHRAHRAVTNGRQRVTVHLEPGQLTHAIRFLAQKWNWTGKRVQHFLSDLAEGGLATTQTTTGQTVITICNWAENQRPVAAATTQTTTQSTTQTTTKEKQLKQLKKNTLSAEGFDLGGTRLSTKVDKARRREGLREGHRRGLDQRT